MADLSEKVRDEQQRVGKGDASACGATLPDAGLTCIRAVHLPDDHAHVGEADSQLIQWADG